MEILLQRLDKYNVLDVAEHGIASSSFDYQLPVNRDEAREHLARQEEIRKRQAGDEFVAFDMDADELPALVGGGRYANGEGSSIIECWVVDERRRQGIGKVIMQAIEKRAAAVYPELEWYEMYIDEYNVAAVALAVSMGYHLTRVDSTYEYMLYQKRREERE